MKTINNELHETQIPEITQTNLHSRLQLWLKSTQKIAHKSTQDRTIRVFIRAILLNLSLRLWLNIFVPWSWSLWIYVTLMTILILTN